MKLKHMILVAGLPICTANAGAQQDGADATAAAEAPSDPILHPAPNFSAWTITYSYTMGQKKDGLDDPSGSAQPMPASMGYRPKTIITTKTGDIIHEETTSLAGSRSEDWQVHGGYYFKYPGRDIWSVYDNSNPVPVGVASSGSMALPASGFRGLDWINGKAYVAKMRTSLGECWVFAPNAPKLTPDKLDTLPTVAYVNPQTRLPVMVRAAGETRTFEFAQPPSSMQKLPDDLAKEIKEGDEMRAKRAAAPLREY